MGVLTWKVNRYEFSHICTIQLWVITVNGVFMTSILKKIFFSTYYFHLISYVWQFDENKMLCEVQLDTLTEVELRNFYKYGHFIQA